MKSCKIYLAGPLFSLAERMFNKRLVDSLHKKMPNLSFVIPQSYANEIYKLEEFNDIMFKHCINSINEADIMLCILDGPDVDSGTCIEMGYAYARGKPIIGVRTDSRESEDRGVNLMVSNVCQELVWLPASRFTEGEIIRGIITALEHVLDLK